MNFLTPLFLVGAFAIAGPVIFHLIRRTTRERTLFSSLLFLEPTPPRLTRKSRIEHWLLLALRCLALGLLAFGFARPFLPRAPAALPDPNQSRRVVLLIDTSASMQRTGAWNLARRRANELAQGAASASELAVMTFDRSVKSRLTFGDWKATALGDRAALVRDRLNAIQPSWAGTQLAAALAAAAEAITETSTGPEVSSRQIVLISDLQEGSHLDSLQAYEWPKGVELIVEAIPIRPPGNAGLQLITDEVNTPATSNSVVRVRVRNSPDATQEQFEVGWLKPEGNGFVGLTAKTYVPAGQSRTLTLTVPDGVHVERIRLTGDDAEFDNTLYVAPPETSRAPILYLGSDAAGDPRQSLYFLQRALPTNGRPAVDWTTRTPDAFATDRKPTRNLIFLTEALTAGSAAALRSAVSDGATLLVVLRHPAMAATLSEILGVPGITAEEVPGGSFALLGEIDFRHPLFASFADPRFSDFTKIRFWNHRRINSTAIPNARVLARFDSGDPGLLEVPVGRGRVLVMTSGWHPDDSQFALATKFVPWLHALLEYSGAIPSVAVVQQFVGDPLTLTAAETARELKLPDGTRQSLPSGTTNFLATTQPGIYRVTASGSSVSFAVNLDPAESRTLPNARDELERLGVPLSRAEIPAAEVRARREFQHAAEAEAQQKLWRWFLGATMLVLLLETAAAGWATRKPQTTSEATV